MSAINTPKTLTCGVSEGSVLRPLLFSMYTSLLRTQSTTAIAKVVDREYS